MKTSESDQYDICHLCIGELLESRLPLGLSAIRKGQPSMTLKLDILVDTFKFANHLVHG